VSVRNPWQWGGARGDPLLVQEEKKDIVKKLLQRSRHRLPRHDSPSHLTNLSCLTKNLPIRSTLIAIEPRTESLELHNGNVSFFIVFCHCLIGSRIAIWLTGEEGNAGW